MASIQSPMTAELTSPTMKTFHLDEKGHNDDVGNETGSLDGSEEPGPCSCCAKIIDEGQVILFNNKCWHPACFRCITCDSLLDTSMNVYLDGDGNPICGNCMHNCSACNQPITDFAMMYGKEMYHEECFRCQECHTTISGTVYASTSRGVYCVKCHNDRVARSRKHHEERKRRAKERAERKARQEREKLSPGLAVDRDKSLPAPPPEPSPNLSTPNTLSPTSLSEVTFPNYSMSGRPNGTAEDEIRLKGLPRNNIAAVIEAEIKLNGNSPEHEFSAECESIDTARSIHGASSKTPESEKDRSYIPVVLDKSTLPNSPSSTQLPTLESPVLSHSSQSPPPNPQIQKLIANKPIKSPPRQNSLPPANLQRKTSISAIAREATEAIGRKISLRTRRKNSKTNSGDSTQEWKLEDIPRRKPSNAGTDTTVTVGEHPRASTPDVHTRTSLTQSKPVKQTGNEVLPRSDNSTSPPISPAQFAMRNDSISEVSTALTPTSVNFDGKNSPPTNVESASPPIPARHPHHHSPKPSVAGSHQSPRNSPQTQKSPHKSSKLIDKSHHSANVSTSYISIGSSRPSSSSSDDAPKTPEHTPTHAANRDSPQLPSIPSPGFLSLEDEMSQIWLQREKQDRKRNSDSNSHKRGGSGSSQTGGASSSGIFSKVTNTLRHNKSMSSDQKLGGIQSRRSSKSHSKNLSQAAAIILADAEDEKAELRRQLRKSINQIVELEVKLKEDTTSTEKRFEVTKDALAGIEAEREMALKELKLLLKHRHSLEDSPSGPGLKEECDVILNDFEASLEKLKDQMRDQIKEYTTVRAQLVEETSRLRTLRDNYLEEAQQLNKKNDELADLNNDIQRNMERAPTHSKSLSETRGAGFVLFKNKKDSPTNASVSSVHSILSKNDLSHPMYFEPKESSEISLAESPVSRVSDSTVIPDEPVDKGVPTRLTDQESIDLPPVPKKFNWKKNTAALRKNAVKGIKSVWSGETSIQVTSPGASISSPQLVSSSSHSNGLVLPANPSPATSFDLYQAEVYKTHSFHPKSFKRWQKCGYCGDKLSGTEIRCNDCDYQCHAKCLMSVTVPCPKSRKGLRDDSSSVVSETATLFGNDLARQAEIEGRPVPYIVTRCIEEVEANGIEYEGIYRKSGGASSLRAITDAFEAGGEVNFDNLVGSGDICAVTSALKQYLRNLPDPLLPFAVYDRFLQASLGNDVALKIAKFKGVFEIMPKVNYDCLQLLMLHLARVVEKSDINLMHATNLAVVFSPTIMRDVTGTRQISDMQATNMCVKFLIEHAKDLFLPRKLSDRSGDNVTGGQSRIVDRRI